MKKKTVCIVTCVALCVIFIGYSIYQFSLGLIVSYDPNILLEHRNEYTQIAELCYNDYLQLKEDDNSIVKVGYLVDDNEFACTTVDHMIELSDEESTAFQIVYDNFYLAKKKLDAIRVQDNFVSFCIVNGMASFTYSVNDQKPDFVNTANENYRRIHVERITDHWYFSCVRKQY